MVTFRKVCFGLCKSKWCWWSTLFICCCDGNDASVGGELESTTCGDDGRTEADEKGGGGQGNQAGTVALVVVS